MAIYTRLSRDTKGTQTSTPRQERLCRSYAEARGWTIAAVYEDPDVSAYSGVPRPSFDALHLAADAGAYDGVLVWKLDRLVRRPSDFERFWAMCEYRGVFLASVTEPVDSSSELGIAVVRLLVTFAGLESSTKSVRQKAKERELAEAGRPHAGRTSFGWIGRYEALHPQQAAMIREAAERVLAGESLRRVATSWNERNLRTGSGGRWSASSVRSLLRKEALVGDRAYHGVVVAEGCWPAVLDRGTFARLQLVLADRARPTNGGTGHYLLTGLLYCGRCGCRLTGQKTRGRRMYKCQVPPHGCSGIGISAASLEAWLTAECARRDAAPFATSPQELLDSARALRALARDYYVEQAISRDEFLAARLGLAQGEPPVFTDQPLGDDPQASRSYISNRMSCAVVQPGAVGLPFDPARIEVAWRTEPVRPLVKRSRPRRQAIRLDDDQWLTGDQARHVLCDMNVEYFQILVRDGRLRAWRARGARFRRSEVQDVLQTMRHQPRASRPPLQSEP